MGAEKGRLYVVGIGPGAYEEMTIRASRVLESVDLIVGYTAYVDLVRDHFPGKEFMTTGMRHEEERCRMAIEEARRGRRVAMICSGDAGVYGMASLMIEMLGQESGDKEIAEDNAAAGQNSGQAEMPDGAAPVPEIEIVPGVTAALSGAAILGAPLTHDFCLISLSDLMTPIEKIRRRIEAAAQSDFVIVLYNPGSRKRADYLQKACDICLKHKSQETICGLVRNIGRQGQERKILTLKELRDCPADMFTTLFIGNSQTKLRGGWMVTPRGYRTEMELGQKGDLFLTL